MDDLLKQGGDGEAPEVMDGLPPAMMRPVAMPIEMQRTYFASVAKILRNPSLAYRKDRQLMKQMRNDPDCMGPLTQLQVSIAGLEWQVKPFDSRDAAQEEIAERTAEIISRIPRFADMIRHLLDAVWYGSSALNLVYSRMPNGIVLPADWLPFHPDTLIVKEDGAPGIKVGPRYYGDPDGTDGTTEQGFDSRVHLFSPLERRAVVWHRYMVQGPDFDDPYETAYAYMGKGVRDTVWWYWNLKQAVLQNWATFSERYAQGIRVGYYPMAQKGAKEDMENILKNMIGDVSAVVPRSTPGQKDYEIEILEPAAARAQVFADLCEWLAKNIKELIVGQSATSEAVSTGIGSNVASQHQKTFTRQMRFIADNLAETITDQVVREIVDMNWGPQEFYPRFEFSVESPEMEKKLEAVRIFVNELGGTVSEGEVRKMLGLAIPEADEPVLTGKIRDVFPAYEDGEGVEDPDDDEPKMLSAKSVFGKMSDEQLRREGIRRRRKGRRGTGNCGNGFGGFTDSNRCASGPHDYPDERKSPTPPKKKSPDRKKKTENAVPDAVIEKHRVLVEEGYADDQAWAIAYDMVARGRHEKMENRQRPQNATATDSRRDRMGELVDKGLSVEQAVQVAVRESVRDRDVQEGDTDTFAKDDDEQLKFEDGFKPPASVAANARRALEVRESKPASERGMTSVGIARARDLANRKSLSADTVRRMVRYFDRHQSDKKGETWDEQGKGWQAWQGWGGDEGWSWARGIVERLDKEAK
jgi:phage gp29-like protein